MSTDESLAKGQSINSQSAHQFDQDDVFFDIKYICNSTSLITDSLQKGCDIAQLPNGDIIVTEKIIVNTHYKWDKSKLKMIKTSQS